MVCTKPSAMRCTEKQQKVAPTVIDLGFDHAISYIHVNTALPPYAGAGSRTPGDEKIYVYI